jgi:replicative DNA helicase
MAEKDKLSSHAPPQALKAEMSVLGAMMMDTEAIGIAIEILDESCFYKDSHKKIFSAALSLYERNEAVDILTLASELERRDMLELIGGEYYLTELVEALPSAQRIEDYAHIVLDKALLRKLIAITGEVQQEAFEAGEDATDIIDRAEQKIFALSEKRVRKDFVHIDPIARTTMDTIESYHERKGGITGIATGFPSLDKLLSGLQKSELIIIAGRPSMGKTALALNIARNAAIESNIPVGIFSLEMADYQLVMRLLCSEAQVDSHKVRTGTLPDREWSKLSTTVGRLAEAPIYIDDTPGLNILELRSKARRLKFEKKVGMILVDYLQLLRGIGRIESRQIEISMISQSLKNLAKELDIPIVALSQLSRAVESRGGERRPLLSDLRESGAIEQDADVVMFIYRPSFYGQHEIEKENIAEIIVAKQRNGPTDTVELIFVKEFVQFANKEAYNVQEIPSFTPDQF